MNRTLLEKKALAELREIASTLELRGYQRMRKADLVDLILGGNGGNGGNGGGATGNGGNGAASHETPAATATATRAPDVRDGQDAGVHRDTNGGRETTTTSYGRDRADDHGWANGGSRDGGTQPAPVSTAVVTRDDDTVTGGEERQRTRARHRPGEPDGGRGDSSRSPEGRTEPRAPESAPGETDTRTDDRADRTDRGDHDRGRPGQGPSYAPRQGDDANRPRGKRERRRKGRGQGGQGSPGGVQGGERGMSTGGAPENLDDAEVRDGVLDLLPEGYGFLRVTGYLSGNKDVYVSQSFVRRYDLRRGDRIGGPIRRNKNNDKYPALARVDTIEGVPVSDEPMPRRVEFKDLTPLFPNERLRLEVGDKSPIAMRLVDMIAPIGKGQRGLLVSPPKAGKTTILKQLAHAIEANNPDVHLMVLLVDERPEEVTDFERSTKGEVISSTFDRPAEDHTQVAELTIERAKRLVERGRDVVILLDSITRLGRAYNLAAPASGRILSGGIDSAALYPPKRFFGAARNIEEGGSLTIIASALIDTGSKMDEVIFEEFKGTGNMELRLDRRMEQKRIFPAIDIQASGTRREELLLDAEELSTIWKLRRLLSTMDSEAALQLLIDKLKATKSNSQFLQMIAKSNLQ